MPAAAYKRCTRCKESKPLVEFYRDRSKYDGLQSSCKPCSLAQGKAWRNANPERSSELNKRWWGENKQRKYAYQSRWRREHPEEHRAKVRRLEEASPEKSDARRIVRNAVAAGALPKPEVCEDCGARFEKRLLDGHHKDYGKPLEVEWLCRACHSARHAK